MNGTTGGTGRHDRRDAPAEQDGYGGYREFGAEGLPALFAALRRRGYTVVGPTARDGAVVLAELESADELPYGWGAAVTAGGYRLRPRADRAAFAHSAGPQSWKTFLHPEHTRLWQADRAPDDSGDFTVREEPQHPPRYAFLGVRPCDLRAIAVLDRVLRGGRHVEPGYAARRDGVFTVVVECVEPGAACFCASMGTGPGLPADAGGWDLALVELAGADRVRYLARAGSAAGRAVLGELPGRPAAREAVREARGAVSDAAGLMGRTMEADGLRELLAGRLGSERWEEIASRCLACANCTLVCPTCFCTTTEEVTDLTGDHAERWQRWDSCFDLESTHLAGVGPVRSSVSSRYRQWLTHKLSTWHDQFGSSGCVGCGRCIAWCPAGIDLTEEVAAFRAEERAEHGAEEEGAGDAGPREEEQSCSSR